MLPLRSLILGLEWTFPITKTMSVVIPDDILRATKMTEDELKLEIATMLYEQQKISSGKVCDWARLTVLQCRRIA
jgi:predicted HTH domain antitoxin